MGSFSIDDKPIINVCELEIHDDKFQKPNIYNTYLPFYDLIKEQESRIV